MTRDPRLPHVDFTGAVLTGADAVGKHLLIRFDDGRTLYAHLRLTGSFVVGRAATEPTWRRRVELWMEDGRLTGVDVPMLGVVATADEDRIVGHLGPDLCGPEPPDLDDVTARLRREPDAPLAGALLDQRNVAGFGNLYAIELPFLVGVSPNQPVGSVDGLRDLVGIGTALIRTNAARVRRTRPAAVSPPRTTGSTPGAGGHARCAGPGSMAGTTATARGSACRRGALGASRWRRGAPSTSSGPTGCWRSTRPARSRCSQGSGARRKVRWVRRRSEAEAASPEGEASNLFASRARPVVARAGLARQRSGNCWASVGSRLRGTSRPDRRLRMSAPGCAGHDGRAAAGRRR